MGDVMLESAYRTIVKYDMLSQNDIVVVGVSGGPDSMALLHFLYTLADEYSLKLYAAHLNHMLRGSESDEDAEYVKEYCGKLNIPCTVRHVDINALAKKYGLSSEEAGRKARYKLFMDVASQIKATKIALAHNLNDQAETVLMRIMRGTGLDGLCGIKPIRDGLYIRPLIHTIRSDIEKYCKDNGITPRTDSTNLEPIYTRNKIRLELIPYIKHNFNSNIEHSLSSMSDILSEDNDFITSYADNEYDKVSTVKDNKVCLSIRALKYLHIAIRRRIIRKAVLQVKGNLTGIESKHIELILKLMDEGDVGAAVELPGSIKVRISYDIIEILKENANTKDVFCHSLIIPGRTYIPEINGFIEAKVCDINSGYRDDTRLVKSFDYDKIKGSLSVRSRAEGDYIVPLGMTGKKKIKELFIDCKVPRDERDSIPLISSGKEVLWVAGYKMSNNYKVDENTKKILKLEFKQFGGTKVLNDVQEILISREKLAKRIKELGVRISEDYENKDLMLIGVLKGSVPFMADLLREITIPCTMDFMAVSSYGSSTQSSGVVRILKDLDSNIEDKNVLIVEDIIDTGYTLKYLIDNLKSRKPADINVCCLLDKPDRRKVNLSIKYTGFKIPDAFVIGYGLDYAEKYRNLPFVGILKREVYQCE